MSLSEVMSAAQRLPLDAQVELAEALLRGLRDVLRSSRPEAAEAELRPLGGMREAELRVLADAVFAPDRQSALSDLLRKNQVLNTAGGRCAYCRSTEALMGVTFEIDHIIPHSAGGETEADGFLVQLRRYWVALGLHPPGRD